MARGRGHVARLALAGLLAGAGASGALAATRELVVEAPSPFKALLEKNLDIERAARLAESDSLDDSEWARLIAGAPAQGRALAQTEGYFRAEVNVEIDPKDPHRIVIRLVPGEPARVGRFTLEFDGELARAAETGDTAAMDLQARLRSEWELQPGTLFRNGNWGDAKAQTLSTLRNQGYAAAQWTATAAQVDPATDQVRLFLVVDTGPRFLAGDIVVEGIERQTERDVRLLSGFGPGTPLTQTRLLDYQDRLQKTGLFDQVAVIYDPDPEQAAHAKVTVRVHEQSLHQATVGVGFSTTTKTRVTIEHADRKLFGLPATLSDKLVWGADVQSLDVSVATHPAESFHSWLVGGSVSSIKTTSDLVRAGSMRFGRTQNSNALDRMTYVQAERSIQCTPKDDPDRKFWYDCVQARALSLNQANVWRNVDSVVLPTAGYTLSAQAGVGWTGGASPDNQAGLAPGYAPYTRLYGRVTKYWPLPGTFYLQGRFEAGQVILLGRGKAEAGDHRPVAVPDAEQWRAGGEDSVRGFGWRELGPPNSNNNVTGGNAMVTGSVEVAQPVMASLPSVWWATFYDAGNAANRFDDLKIERGYGLGVRWRSPVGPLKVDVSHGQGTHGVHLDLGIGVVF